MRECPNHAGTAASIQCTRCAKDFCDSCTVKLLDRMYCGACKGVVARGMLAPPPSSSAADDAIKCALVGIFCFPPLGPYAVVKGIQALREVERDPRVGGKGKAITAIVIGSTLSLLYVLYIGLIILGALRH